MTSTHPPASPTALAEPLEAEPTSERDEEGDLDEPFEPPVDDLRGPRAVAPRKVQGPLGMDDARHEGGESVSVAPVRVVEIGGPPHGSDNSNDTRAHDDRLDRVAPVVEPRLAHAPAEMDEPFAPPSVPPPARGSELGNEDRYADDEELRAASEPPPEPERVPAAQLVSHAPGQGFTMGAGAHAEAEEALEQEPPQGFSTVFHARPSLRPSPPPPPRSALGWWVVILLLSSIIVAALVVAVREEMEAREEPPYLVAPAPPPKEETPSAAAKPVDAPPAPEPAPTPAPEAPATVSSDAGAKVAADASVAAKPARVWKPRPKPVAGDAGALSAPRGAPGPVEAPPIESVPSNPYGRP